MSSDRGSSIKEPSSLKINSDQFNFLKEIKSAR